MDLTHYYQTTYAVFKGRLFSFKGSWAQWLRYKWFTTVYNMKRLDFRAAFLSTEENAAAKT